MSVVDRISTLLHCFLTLIQHAFHAQAKRLPLSVSVTVLNPTVHQFGHSKEELNANAPPILHGRLIIRPRKRVRIMRTGLLFDAFTTITASEPSVTHFDKRQFFLQHGVWVDPYRTYAFPFSIPILPATAPTISAQYVSVKHSLSGFVQYFDPLESSSHLQFSDERHITVTNYPSMNSTEPLALVSHGNWRDILIYQICAPSFINKGYKCRAEVTMYPLDLTRFQLDFISLQLIQSVIINQDVKLGCSRGLSSDSDHDDDPMPNSKILYSHTISLKKMGQQRFTRSDGSIFIPLRLRCPTGVKYTEIQTTTSRRSDLGIKVSHIVQVRIGITEKRAMQLLDKSVHHRRAPFTPNSALERLEQATVLPVARSEGPDHELTRYDPVVLLFLPRIRIQEACLFDLGTRVPKYNMVSPKSERLPRWARPTTPPVYPGPTVAE